MNFFRIIQKLASNKSINRAILLYSSNSQKTLRIPFDKYRVEVGFWLDVTAQHYFMNQDFTPAHGMLGFQMTKTRNKDPRHQAAKE